VRDLDHGAEAAANSWSKVRAGGAIWTRVAASGVSESSRILRSKRRPLSPSAMTAIFFFFSSAMV
jgi:hypothetical protein